MKKSLLTIVIITFVFCLPAFCGPFTRDDKNGDDRLSREEFKGPARAFERLDSNDDGFIDREELSRSKIRKRRDIQKKEDTGAPYVEKVANVSTSGGSALIIDTHNHLAGWIGPGGSSGFEAAAQTALRTMNKLGIRTMILMPTPQTINQEGSHTLNDYIEVIRKHPDRFAMLGGGGTLNVMIRRAVIDGKTSPDLKREFEKTAEELSAKGALGFGEMTTEHFSLNRTHPYISTPPDHPLFLLLADIAARRDVPIDLHMEAIPQDMPLPERLRKMPNNPETLRANIPAFERLLSHNSKAKIIWVHAGWDNTGHRTTELTDSLMRKHQNLYLGIRVVPRSIPGRPTDSHDKIKPDWLALIDKYQDRIMIGSDEFFMPRTGGKKHPSSGSAEKTVMFLSLLPDGIAKKVGYSNAIRLYKLAW